MTDEKYNIAASTTHLATLVPYQTSVGVYRLENTYLWSGGDQDKAGSIATGVSLPRSSLARCSPWS